MLRPPAGGCGGSTIVEIMVAMSIVVIFFSGIFLMSSQVLGLLRASLESTASLRALSGRAEQVRSSTWTQLTDATYLAGTVLPAAPDSGGDLSALTETIEVTAYLAAPGTVTPIKVSRDANATVTTITPGDANVPTQTSVRVDLTANWLSRGGKLRMRQMSMIVGQGGITGRN